MQKVELIAFTKTLELGARKKINIHVHSMLCLYHSPCPQGYMPRRRTTHIRGNKQEILDLLDALMVSVCIIHCPGCQKGKDSVENN